MKFQVKVHSANSHGANQQLVRLGPRVSGDEGLAAFSAALITASGIATDLAAGDAVEISIAIAERAPVADAPKVKTKKVEEARPVDPFASVPEPGEIDASGLSGPPRELKIVDTAEPIVIDKTKLKEYEIQSAAHYHRDVAKRDQAIESSGPKLVG